jgi:predicted Zn-dependent protease with MMP-like domain
VEHPEFEKIVSEAFLQIPEKFRTQMENVGIVIEEEPDRETLLMQGLTEPEDTLLGLYSGIPHTERGEGYGIAGTMPDKITIYRLPNELEAEESGKPIAQVVYETLWHEIAHHFGMDENEVEEAEKKRGIW